MVRTKAGSVSTKAVGAKAPQKVAITAILSGNAAKGRNHSGGNSYHPRETPGWQKPITFFMKGGESSKDVSKEGEEEEDGISDIGATKTSKKKTLDTDMEVEEIEEVEVKNKKVKVEKTDKPKDMKKPKEKRDTAKISKDDSKEEQDEEEEEDQGIPGIAATEPSNKKILGTHNDMEVEESVEAEIVKEKVKKEDSKKIKKDEGEDKENELKKEDIKKKEAPEAKKDEGENKENQFTMDDTIKKRDLEDEQDASKDENIIQDKTVPKTEQTESKVLEKTEPEKKEDPKEEKDEGKQDDQI